jgi:type 1 fimbria pilin
MFKNARFSTAIVVAAVCVLAATVSPANAATTAELTISGIIEPPACNLTVTGSIDFGTMPKSQVANAPLLEGPYGSAYQLNATTYPALTVDCEGPRAFSLSITDNKASSVAPLDNYDSIYQMGFGNAVGGARIGAWSTYLHTVSVTSTVGGPATSPTGFFSQPIGATGPWTLVPGSGFSWELGNKYGVQAAADQTSPPSLTGLTGSLSVFGRIDKAFLDNMTATTHIDGSVTVTLMYL